MKDVKFFFLVMFLGFASNVYSKILSRSPLYLTPHSPDVKKAAKFRKHLLIPRKAQDDGSLFRSSSQSDVKIRLDENGEVIEDNSDQATEVTKTEVSTNQNSEIVDESGDPVANENTNPQEVETVNGGQVVEEAGEQGAVDETQESNGEEPKTEVDAAQQAIVDAQIYEAQLAKEEENNQEAGVTIEPEPEETEMEVPEVEAYTSPSPFPGGITDSPVLAMESAAENSEMIQKNAVRTQIDQYGAVLITDEEVPLGYVNAPTTPNGAITAYTGSLPTVSNQSQPVLTINTSAKANPYVKTVTVSAITYEDVDTLMNILSAIQSIFKNYYDALPGHIAPSENENPEEAEKENFNRILEFYRKIRSFIHAVVFNKDNLFRDLGYFDAKVKTLGASEQKMLRFYGYQYKYYQLKADSNAYLSSNGDEINAQFDKVQKIHAHFDAEVNNIVSGAFDLSRLNDYFQTEISALADVGYQDRLTNALDKFDKVVMFVVRLIEIKMDIQKSISQAQKSLINCKSFRMDIEEAMMTVQNIVDKNRLAASIKKWAGVAVTLFSAFVLLF